MQATLAEKKDQVRVPPAVRRFLRPNLFGLTALLLLGLNYFAPFGDLDYTWQIRLGQKILATGDLMPADSFTYTIAGQRVPEFEGAYEIALAVIWQLLGSGGLKLLKTIMVFTPLFLLAFRLRQRNVPLHHIMTSIVVAVLVLIPCWNLRPYYLTTLGLFVTTWMLQDHCLGRRPLPWYFPLLMFAWANLHPGVITGQGLIVGAIGWEWLNRRLSWNMPLAKSSCWRLTIIGGLGLAATLVSPHPFERLILPFSANVTHPIQKLFIEMQSPWRHLADPAHLSLWLLYFITAAVAVSVYLRWRSFRLWEIALLLGVVGLGNLALRSLQDWTYILLAVGVPHLSPLVRRLRIDRTIKKLAVSRAMRPALFWPSAGFAILALVSMVPAWSRNMPRQNSSEWPVSAMAWCANEGVTGNFFASPDYGTFIGWKLGDRAKVYTDTRGFSFPGALLEDSLLTQQLCPGWQSRLTNILDSGTDYLLLETSGPRGKLWEELREGVGRPLYVDQQAVLLTSFQVRQFLTVQAARSFRSADLATGP